MRRSARAVLVVVLATSLAVTACTKKKSSTNNGSTTGPVATTTNDINAVPYDKVPAGGTLHWPIDRYPANFNPYTPDGSDPSALQVLDATLPVLWHFTAAGTPELNTDVVTSAKQTSSSPQTITYRISDKAKWSDGTAVTYKDFVGIWQADNGTTKAYHAASTTGYEQIRSVDKGSSEREVVVTFTTPFTDWQSLFSPLVPSSLTDTPAHFNDAWATSAPVAGGPFAVTGADGTHATLALERNAQWWGKRARLDRIEFVVMPQADQLEALKSGRIDFMDVGASQSTTNAVKSVKDVVVRKSGGATWVHIDLGKSGPLADVRVRQAVELAIDRVAQTRTTLGKLGWPVTVLDSHLWLNNQAQYRATCGDFCNRDLRRAGSLLTAAGYTKSPGRFFARSGKTLALTFLVARDDAAQLQAATSQRTALEQAGIKVTISQVAASSWLHEVTTGSYDLCVRVSRGTPFPLSSAKAVYSRGGARNPTKVGSQEVDDLFRQVVSAVDRQRAVDLSYTLDQKIWELGVSVPIYQRPDFVAAKTNLANFGSEGLADVVYEGIGFTK